MFMRCSFLEVDCSEAGVGVGGLMSQRSHLRRLFWATAGAKQQLARSFRLSIFAAVAPTFFPLDAPNAEMSNCVCGSVEFVDGKGDEGRGRAAEGAVEDS